MVRVCFVCLGNICRSPTAEGVMRHLVREAGLESKIEVDSAGTAGYHAGEPPDARACAAGKRRGVEIRGKARQFKASDFELFEYVVAMDRANYRELEALAERAESTRRLFLLRSFDPESAKGASVPDPYYGGDEGFDEVFDICWAACQALLETIKKEHRL